MGIDLAWRPSPSPWQHHSGATVVVVMAVVREVSMGWTPNASRRLGPPVPQGKVTSFWFPVSQWQRGTEAQRSTVTCSRTHARMCQSWDLNLGHLPLKTCSVTTALWLAELTPSLACVAGDMWPPQALCAVGVRGGSPCKSQRQVGGAPRSPW